MVWMYSVKIIYDLMSSPKIFWVYLAIQIYLIQQLKCPRTSLKEKGFEGDWCQH